MEVPATPPPHTPPVTQPSGSDLRHLVHQIQSEGVDVQIGAMEVPSHGHNTRQVRHQVPSGSGVGRSGVPASAGSPSLTAPGRPEGGVITERRTVSMDVTMGPAVEQPPCAGKVTEDTVVAATQGRVSGQQATKAATDVVVILDNDSSGAPLPVTDLFAATGPNWPVVEEVAEPTYLVSDHYRYDDRILPHRVRGCKTAYTHPLAYVGLPDGVYYDPQCLDDPREAALMESGWKAGIPMPFPLDFLKTYENILSISETLFNVFIFGRKLFKQHLLNQMNNLKTSPLTSEELELLTDIASAWHDLRCGVVAPGRYDWFGRGIRWSSQHDSASNLRPVSFSMKKAPEVASKPPTKPLVHIEDPKKFWLVFQPRIVHEAKGSYHESPRAKDAGFNLAVWAPPENRVYCGVPGCKSQFVSNFGSLQNLGRHWNCAHNHNIRIARCPFTDPVQNVKCLHESKTVDRISEYLSPAHRRVHQEEATYDTTMRKYFHVDPNSGLLIWDPKTKDYARDQLSADQKENWLCVVVRRAEEIEELPKGFPLITGFVILCREPGILIPLTSAINLADTVRVGVERQSYTSKQVLTVLEPGESFTSMVYDPAGNMLSPEQEHQAKLQDKPLIYQIVPTKYLPLVVQGPIDPVRHLLRTAKLLTTGEPGEEEKYVLINDPPTQAAQSGEEEGAADPPAGASASPKPAHEQAGYWDEGVKLLSQASDRKDQKDLIEKAKVLPPKSAPLEPLSTHRDRLRSGEIPSQYGFAEHFLTVLPKTKPTISGELKGHRYPRPPEEMDDEHEFRLGPRRDKIQEKEDSQPALPKSYSDIPVRMPGVWTFDPKTGKGHVIDVPQPPGTRARERAIQARLNDPAYQDPPIADRVQLSRYELDRRGCPDNSGVEFPGSLWALQDRRKREVRAEQSVEPSVRRSQRMKSSVTTRSYVSETPGARARQPLTGQQKRRYQPSTYEEQAELEEELAESVLSSPGRKKGAEGPPSGAPSSPDSQHSGVEPARKSLKASPSSKQTAEILLELREPRVEAQATSFKQPVSTTSSKDKGKQKRSKKASHRTTDAKKKKPKRLQKKSPPHGPAKVTRQAIAEQSATQLEESTSSLASLPPAISDDPRLAQERAKLKQLQSDAQKAQETFIAYNRNLQKEQRKRDRETAELRQRQANVTAHEKLLLGQLKEVEHGSTRLAQNQADLEMERVRLHAEIAHRQSALGVTHADLQSLIKPVTDAAFNQQEIDKLKSDKDALVQQLEESKEEGQYMSQQNSCSRQLIELMNSAIAVQAPVNPEAAREIESLKQRIGELIALMPDPAVILPAGTLVEPLSPNTISPVDTDLLRQSQFAFESLLSASKEAEADPQEASTSGPPTEEDMDTENQETKTRDDDDDYSD